MTDRGSAAAPAARAGPPRSGSGVGSGPILVTGGQGQVGRWIRHLGLGAGHNIVALPSTQLDIRRRASIARALATYRPSVVINTAAHTAVDAAETEVAEAFALNRDAAEAVAQACAASATALIHLSTDYVFGADPGRSRPWEPGEERRPNSVYGRSKAEGEDAVLAVHPGAVVARTAWVYTGPARAGLGLRGEDFVTTMLRLAREQGEATVVDDQVGSPTYAADLAAALLQLAAGLSAAGRGLSGAAAFNPTAFNPIAFNPTALNPTAQSPGRLVHLVGGGSASWFEVARAVFRLSGYDESSVKPCGTVDFPRPAPRPAYSVLATTGLRERGITPLRPWQEALAAALGVPPPPRP